MRKFLAVLCLLAGCSEAREIDFSNGASGYLITCDGTALSMGHCHDKAVALCPAGYDVVDAEGRQRKESFSAAGGDDRVRNVRGGYVDTSGTTVRRSLYVRCR